MAADIQLTRNPSGGTNFGQSATEKIACYGVTPVVQRVSTVLATSLLSASSYVSIASNTAAIVSELSKALIGFGIIVTA